MHVALLLLTLAGTMTPHRIPTKATLAGLERSEYSRALQAIADRAVARTLDAFQSAALDSGQLAVTLVDLGPSKVQWASVRGSTGIYPASVVKLFYLLAAHRWMEDGKLEDSEELRRALKDMIVDSSNDATSYVLDVLTGTTSGPELPPAELETWAEKRNVVNRWLETAGYHGINCNKKPWGDGPYGRETQAMKAFTPSRNALTTDATARLLTEIALGRAVSGARSSQMMELLSRDPSVPSTDPDDQAHAFSAQALGPGMKLWSKAGWTSRVRHDAACIELPNGRRFVLVTFSEGHGEERGIIARVAREVIEGMQGR